MPEDTFSNYPETGSQGEKEYHARDDVSIFQTEKNPRSEYEPPAPDVDYGVGADGYVTPPAKSSGGGGSAPFIHPFKIESVTDPDTNTTKTRVYKGNLFARIDTFLLTQRTITTSVQSYHATSNDSSVETANAVGHSLSGTSATLPQHQHGAGDELLIPQHEHEAGSGTNNLKAKAKVGLSEITTGTTATEQGHTHSVASIEIPEHKHVARDSTEDGLLMPNHEHNAGAGTDNLKIPQHAHVIGISGNTNSVVNSGGSNTCQDGGHYHQVYINQNTANIVSGTDLSVTGKTDEVKDYDSSSSNVVKKVTGRTGGIYDKNNNDNLTGSTAVGTTHAHTYNKDDHSHDIEGYTEQIKDYSSNPSKKRVTGNTGNVEVDGSSTLPPIPITVGSGISHKHKAPLLQSTTTDHKFIEVAGQDFPDANDLDNDKATDWGETFNKTVTEDDGTSTIFEYHESSSSTGIFYVKWVITINESANVSSIVGSIHRTALGVAAPTNINFGALTPPEAGKLTRAEAGRIGTFYQKIGEAHPTYVKQDQFSNINWSMTVLPEVNPNP